MVTPFREGGALDLDAARRLATHLTENGSHGVVVAGTTGESPTLSDDEKIELLDAVLGEIGADATVICGTGSNDTRHACGLTQRAAEAGAHGVLVVSPYYNKPSDDGLRAHFAAVAEAAGECPIVLYNIPSRSVINMSPDLMAELARDNEPIVAVKQANNDEIGPIEGLDVLAGNDDIFAACLREGGTGGILVASHLAGLRMRELYDTAKTGNHDGAAEIETELQPLYGALSAAPPASAVKAALAMAGLIGETQRLPMVPVSASVREDLRNFIQNKEA